MAGFTPTNRDGSLTKPSGVVSSTGKFKPVARIPAPQEKPLSNKIVDFIGLKPASDVIASHIARAKAPEELKQFIEKPTIKQDVGAAMQIIATIAPFNIARNLAVKGAGTAFTPVAREMIGASAQGAAAGYTFDVGANLAEGENLPEALKPGVGTAVGAIGGPLLTGVARTIASSKLRAKTPEQFAEEAAARAPYTVPEAGRPSLGQEAAIEATQGTRLLPEPRVPAIELPSPQVAASQRLINERPVAVEAPTPVPDRNSPDINIRAQAFNSRNDFIQAEQAKNVGTRIVTSKTGQAIEKPITRRKVSETQLAKIWDKNHAIKPYEMLSYQKPVKTIGKSVLPKNKVTAPTDVSTGAIPATKTSPETVGYKEREIPGREIPQPVAKYTEDDFNRAERVLDEDPTYTPGTNREKVAAFYQHLAQNTGKIDDIIDSIYSKDGGNLPKNLPRSAAYQLLREQTQLLTPKQIQRLLNKEPLSKAGQDLQAAKVKAGSILTNPLDMVDKLKAELMDKAEKLLTKNGVKNFLDELECR